MKYRVVWDEDEDDFVEKVNAALADGWSPQGGIAVTNNPIIIAGLSLTALYYYYQALIKE